MKSRASGDSGDSILHTKTTSLGGRCLQYTTSTAPVKVSDYTEYIVKHFNGQLVHGCLGPSNSVRLDLCLLMIAPHLGILVLDVIQSIYMI